MKYHAQDLLSQVRTDLDTFTDIEAFSLMANGYVISEKEFAGKKPFENTAGDPGDGSLYKDNRFEKCLQWLKNPSEKWEKHMEVAAETVFKVFRLKPIVLGVPFFLILLALLYLAWPTIDAFLSQPMWVLVIPLGVIALGMAVPWLGKTLKALKWFFAGPGELFRRALMDVALPVIGGFFIWLYLMTLDKLFVKLGKL
ncbi:MAG: hypothetical protein GWM98_27680 [Nitrospinaceae bacterium]|nr:hypothetical protein [Nitrospinaceae bacterium]NIR57546.1 hypothetical protein [Nitrospinaceae bacterium]NIS88016.1 hypothetical protein [Nitrospinaceae bacterium]NIT84880.1 hypothetical protein [Nitrospinaceae bacterium]NIU47056.1 hypothetical protein [Nitrospinaceae bacterium]